MQMATILAWILTAGGVAYLLLALFHLAGFRPHHLAPYHSPPVTLRVPAHGESPRLEDCPRSARQHIVNGCRGSRFTPTPRAASCLQGGGKDLMGLRDWRASPWNV